VNINKSAVCKKPKFYSDSFVAIFTAFFWRDVNPEGTSFHSAFSPVFFQQN